MLPMTGETPFVLLYILRNRKKEKKVAPYGGLCCPDLSVSVAEVGPGPSLGLLWR